MSSGHGVTGSMRAAQRRRGRTQKALRAAAAFYDALCAFFVGARDATIARQQRAATTLSHAHIDQLSLAAYQRGERCDERCSAGASGFPLRLYSTSAGAPEAGARGALLPAGATALAIDAGILPPTTARDTRLHACGQFCATRGTLDALHAQEVASAALESSVHYCARHQRFHVCTATCALRQAASNTQQRCVLSARTFAGGALQFVFGDGTGTAERAAQTAAARAAQRRADGGALTTTDEAAAAVRRVRAPRRGGQKRRATLDVRSEPAAAAAAAKKGGGGGGGGRRKKTRKTRATSGAAAANGTAQLAANAAKIECRLGADEHQLLATSVAAAGVGAPLPETFGGDVHTLASVRPAAPFERREGDALKRELVLDALHDRHCRDALARVVNGALPEAGARNAFFMSGELVARHVVRAYEIVRRMLFGFQRCAVERRRLERAHDAARRVVRAHIEACAKDGRVLLLSELETLYAGALTTRRRYTRLTLSAAEQRAALVYYALLATEFYLGLRALPVRVPPADADADYATVRTQFAFEHFVPIALDMMRADFTIDGVRVLPRDTFLVAEYAPDPAALRALGLPENTCTHVRNATVHLLRVATRQGVALRRVQTTEFQVAELCALARTASPRDVLAETVRRFVARRAARLAAITRVVAPRDNMHPAVVDLLAADTPV